MLLLLVTVWVEFLKFCWCIVCSLGRVKSKKASAAYAFVCSKYEAQRTAKLIYKFNEYAYRKKTGIYHSRWPIIPPVAPTDFRSHMADNHENFLTSAPDSFSSSPPGTPHTSVHKSSGVASLNLSTHRPPQSFPDFNESFSNVRQL